MTAVGTQWTPNTSLSITRWGRLTTRQEVHRPYGPTGVLLVRRLRVYHRLEHAPTS
jgi:hypothetical protein